MTDPERLMHGGDELEAALLRSAADDAPSSEARQRALTAIAAASIASAGATATTAASSSKVATASLVALVKWTAAGALAGAVAIGAVNHFSPAPPVVAAPVDAPNAEKMAPVFIADTPSPAVAAPSASAAIVASARPKAAAVATDSAPREASLGDEIAALDEARVALSGGNAAASLAALDAYDRRFPNGRMRQESTVLRVDAFLASGDRKDATTLARAYLSMHPESPHAARLRRLVGVANP